MRKTKFYDFQTKKGNVTININEISSIEDLSIGTKITMNSTDETGKNISYVANLPWATVASNIQTIDENQDWKMDINVRLLKLGKLFKRIGLSLFGLIWIELIILILPNFKSLGETINENYGVNGLAYYFSIIIVAASFFLWSHTQIELIKKEYLKEKTYS